MIGLFSILSGVTNTDPTQLGLPSLTAVLSSDSLTQRQYQVNVAGPTTWPGGVTVQIQTRISPAAFATVSTTPTGTTLTFTKTGAPVVVEVRGIAINGGTLTDSGSSAVLTLTIPAALGAVVAGGTPLRWRARTLPPDASTTSDSIQRQPATLPLRALSPNRIIVDRVEDPERPIAITPTAVSWTALASGDVVLGTGALSSGPADWRATFTPNAATRAIEVRVTAPDASVTVVRYPVTLTA